MKPEQAHKRGYLPGDCHITSTSHRHNSHWIVRHEPSQRVLTSSPSVLDLLTWLFRLSSLSRVDFAAPDLIHSVLHPTEGGPVPAQTDYVRAALASARELLTAQPLLWKNTDEWCDSHPEFAENPELHCTCVALAVQDVLYGNDRPPLDVPYDVSLSAIEDDAFAAILEQLPPEVRRRAEDEGKFRAIAAWNDLPTTTLEDAIRVVTQAEESLTA